MTLTTDCVHIAPNPRLAASIHALCATHTLTETDIYPLHHTIHTKEIENQLTQKAHKVRRHRATKTPKPIFC
jgi:hypothetical protein